MFSFLQPIWLFGAAALFIPVLIHLWNIRPGKVLKVGSIALIDAASRKSSRSFKLLDVPLFILRCLLLLLLAVLLALPVWQKKQQAAKIKGWVLLPKQDLQATYNQFKLSIDSLTKAGYEFHYFNDGFTRSDLQQTFLHAKDSIQTQAANTPAPNYWNLIRQLDQRVAATLPVYLFTPNKASYFQGTRPQAALDLKWRTYTPADSVTTFIQDAWFTPAGDVKVVQGTAKPSGTVYTYSNVKPNGGSNAAFNINTTDGKAQISLNGSKQTPVVIDNTTHNIVIYADNGHVLDAGYVKAALQAVGQFGERKYSLKTVSTPSAIADNTSWLFWLSDKSLPSSIISKATHILAYQPGKIVNTTDWMSSAGQFATALPSVKKVNLYKQVNSANTSGDAVWLNGSGQSILSSTTQDSTTVYQFYSRFNPTWNDLVWSDNFPAWMLSLMQGPVQADNPAYDQRTLSLEQYSPQIITEKQAAATKIPVEHKDLGRYFWIALMLVFAAERWLAHRNSITNNA